MRTLEGIRYLINLDSAEIQQNFAGGVAPPDKVESEVDTCLLYTSCFGQKPFCIFNKIFFFV